MLLRHIKIKMRKKLLPTYSSKFVIPVLNLDSSPFLNFNDVSNYMKAVSMLLCGMAIFTRKNIKWFNPSIRHSCFERSWLASSGNSTIYLWSLYRLSEIPFSDVSNKVFRPSRNIAISGLLPQVRSLWHQ